MSHCTKIDDGIFVAGQITPEDVKAAAGDGFALVINNRPDFEEKGQPEAAEIEAAASAAGLDYVAIPVGAEGIGMGQIDAMAKAVAAATGPVLAFCRSGNRSSMLWALSQAYRGCDVEEVAAKVRAADYNPAMILPVMEELASTAA